MVKLIQLLIAVALAGSMLALASPVPQPQPSLKTRISDKIKDTKIKIHTFLGTGGTQGR
ncbi:hypothetical protein H4R33_006411 [Dimargaris cristalligena]|nr:hypothetical protein H4R33_006411 [Dimargaris cristalligena]